MTLVLLHDGMVDCPLRMFAGMARDACCAEQAKRGIGCGFGCVRGRAALEARRKHRSEEKREEQIRAKVREKHAEYYRRWGLLPSQLRPTTRAGRRARKPREPRPGGIDFTAR